MAEHEVGNQQIAEAIALIICAGPISVDRAKACALTVLDNNNVVSPGQFAEWCCEVERLHEASWTTPAMRYNKSYKQALLDSQVPEAWREVVALLVWNKSFAELWDWCKAQGVEPREEFGP